MAKRKLVEILTGAGIDNVEEILTIALSSRMEDANEVAIAERPKREVGVWLVLLVVIVC